MESWGSGVDCGVGSIVWVRRRNGSWWPGKIMGPDELSASHLMSPRTGTPVKLLGREDASVDWYNLEKSKRVKAFRCGEFDECIERAESSLGMPAKKREKYARREDAILHALELEKELLEKEQGQLIASGLMSSNFSDSVKHGNAKPDQFSTGSDSSHKDEKDSPFYVPKDKERSMHGLGDVKSESIPPMTGLQDFGLKTTHSKQKFCSVTSNGSRRPTANDHGYASSYNTVSMRGTSHANSKNFVHIRKRTNEELTEDTLVKRREKHRHNVKVPQSSANLPASHLLQSDSLTPLSESGVNQMENICRAKRNRCMYLPSELSNCVGNSESVPNQMETYVAEGDFGLPGSLMEENPCEFIEDEQSEFSETEDLVTDSDGETNSLSGSSDTDSEATGGSEVQGKNKSVSNEEFDEWAVSGDLSSLHPHDHAPANAAKWQMKGKRNRNVRYLTNKLGVGADVKGSSGFIAGTHMEEKEITFKRRALEHGLNFNHRSDGFSNDPNKAEIIDKDYRTQTIGFNNRRYTSTSKAASNYRNRSGHDIVDWEDLAWEDQPSFRGYLDAGEYLNPVFVGRHHLGGRMRTTLIDVDLKVQASYKKEHVPIVSLMSKLDGRAIIGHPIQIEVLREGVSENLFSTKNDFGNEAHYNEVDRTLPTVWRTARRTANCRVPRPKPSSALDNDDAAEHLPNLGQERKPSFKKLNSRGFSRKESMTSKDRPHIHRPPIDRKLSRKLPKKVSLSSIGIEQKFRHPKYDTDGYPLDGFIKTDYVPTAVACIPLKLVFSRLYEAVGRPQSGASTANHETFTNMNTETNPL